MRPEAMPDHNWSVSWFSPPTPNWSVARPFGPSAHALATEPRCGLGAHLVRQGRLEIEAAHVAIEHGRAPRFTAPCGSRPCPGANM